MVDKQKTRQTEAATQAEADRQNVDIQVVHKDLDAAVAAAAQEAEVANVTPGAVLKSSPEGYATGDGTTWPPKK